MIPVILFLAACFVAFTNGANANFKGVASLYGSGTTTLRTAALWGTATTLAGLIAALFLAEGPAHCVPRSWYRPGRTGCVSGFRLRCGYRWSVDELFGHPFRLSRLHDARPGGGLAGCRDGWQRRGAVRGVG